MMNRGDRIYIIIDFILTLGFLIVVLCLIYFGVV